MSQQVKTLSPSPDGLRSMPGPHMLEGEYRLPLVFLTSLYPCVADMHTLMHAHMYTHTLFFVLA